MLERVKKYFLAVRKIHKWNTLTDETRLAKQITAPTDEDYKIIKEGFSEWSEEELFERRRYERLLDNISNRLYWFLACSVSEHRNIAERYENLICEWTTKKKFVEICNNLSSYVKLGRAPSYEVDVKDFIGDSVPMKVFKNGKIKIDEREISRQLKNLTNEIKDYLLLHIAVGIVLVNKFTEWDIFDLIGEDIPEMLGILASPIIEADDVFEVFNTNSDAVITESDLPLFSQILTPQKLKVAQDSVNQLLQTFEIYL